MWTTDRLYRSTLEEKATVALMAVETRSFYSFLHVEDRNLPSNLLKHSLPAVARVYPHH